VKCDRPKSPSLNSQIRFNQHQCDDDLQELIADELENIPDN
jgi:hypothetical protein